MESSTSYTFSLDVVLIKDAKTGAFTGYFKQFPNIITEGDSEKETVSNLLHGLNAILEDRRNTKSDLAELPTGVVIERSVNFKTLEFAS